MKKSLVLVLSWLLLCGFAFADEYAIFGGIRGDLTLKEGVYYYQEVTFASGKPLILKGTVTIPKAPDRSEYTLSIKYSLGNTAEQATLERTVNYKVVKSKNNTMGQEIIDTTIPIGGLKETLVIGSNTYNLTSYQFSGSSIVDLQPGIQFESGNLYYKKIFYLNGDETTGEGKLTLTGESNADLAFTNRWSDLATRIVAVNVKYEPSGDGANGWDGQATLKFSTKKTSQFAYVSNDVQHISFRGGLLKSDNTDIVLQYSYDMPPEAEDGPRIKGESTLNTYSFETSTRLPVPKYNDLAGHWAEEAAFRMGSLEAFDTDTFFFPDTYITREQFARALVNAIDYVKPETKEERLAEAIKLTRPTATPLVFEDVRRDSPYYIYVDRVYTDGLMVGEGNKQFLPTRPLTRAEAITVMIRALGIQDIAPALPYDTGYADDVDIPMWAKDAFYMARETGIIKGYEDGSVRPLQLMTRAEASKMLSEFIDHLRVDITLDYREKLLHQY